MDAEQVFLNRKADIFNEINALIEIKKAENIENQG